MKRISREQLEITVRQTTEEANLSAIAMNAAVEGSIKWFGRGVYRLGVIAPTSPHGGVVIVRFAPRDQKPHSSAYYWESWYQAEMRWTVSVESDADRKRLRELATEAWEWVVAHQREAFSVKVAPLAT